MLSQMLLDKTFEHYNVSSLKKVFFGGSKPSKLVIEKTKKALPNAFVSNAYG